MKFSEYDPDELRAVSRRAGVASGKARRKKRARIEREKIHDIAMREHSREMLKLLDMALSIDLVAAKDIARARGIDPSLYQ